MGIFGGGSPEKVLAQVEALLKKKGSQDAARALRERIEDPSDLPDELKNRFAGLYLTVGMVPQAEALAVSLVARSDQPKEVRTARAFLEEHLGKWKDPVRVIDVVWQELAKAGDWDEARKFTRRAADIAPAAFPALKDLARGRADGAGAAPAHTALAHLAIA